jgi:hypothetical protein
LPTSFISVFPNLSLGSTAVQQITLKVGIALEAGGDHERLTTRLASAKAGLSLIAGQLVTFCVVIGFLLVFTPTGPEQQEKQQNDTYYDANNL